MTASAWLQVLLLGALLGAAGQLVRSIAGLKKLNDSSAAKGLTLGEAFSVRCMVVSVLIGALAGILGAVSLGIDPRTDIPGDKLAALIGIDYAGADFVEAFMSRVAKPHVGSTSLQDLSPHQPAEDPKAVG